MFGVYTIYDKVAQQCGPLFQAVTDGVAKRQYMQIIRSDVVAPDDFELRRLALFDETKCELSPQVPYHVVHVEPQDLKRTRREPSFSMSSEELIS